MNGITTKQSGFTLIELMIVVAIIGILAAIAIPQYTNYVARAQASEAVVLMRSSVTAVEDFAITNGNFPAQGDLEAKSTGRNGSYTIALEFSGSETCSGAGLITATFQDDANEQIKDKSLIYSRTTTGAWSCTKTASNQIDDRYLPNHCQQEPIADEQLCAG